jgi:hypothetical protein
MGLAQQARGDGFSCFAVFSGGFLGIFSAFVGLLMFFLSVSLAFLFLGGFLSFFIFLFFFPLSSLFFEKCLDF